MTDLTLPPEPPPVEAPLTTRAPRSRFAAAPAGRVVLGVRDEALLLDLCLHGVMSRTQIQALHFGSVPRCNARLRQLFDAGYVRRHFLPLARWGSEAVYSVGRPALPLISAALEREGIAVDDLILRPGRGDPAPQFLEHTLAITDFRLAVRRAVADAPDVELERWLAEPLCRHEYDLRPAGGGPWRREAFKPDGFLRLALRPGNGPPVYRPFFLEIDRGHVSSARFRGKLRGHQRYLESGLFTEVFGPGQFRTLVVTTGERRLANLRALVEGQGSALFWFTTFEAVERQGALALIWQVPGQGGPVSLRDDCLPEVSLTDDGLPGD